MVYKVVISIGDSTRKMEPFVNVLRHSEIHSDSWNNSSEIPKTVFENFFEIFVEKV